MSLALLLLAKCECACVVFVCVFNAERFRLKTDFKLIVDIQEFVSHELYIYCKCDTHTFCIHVCEQTIRFFFFIPLQ